MQIFEQFKKYYALGNFLIGFRWNKTESSGFIKMDQTAKINQSIMQKISNTL